MKLDARPNAYESLFGLLLGTPHNFEIEAQLDHYNSYRIIQTAFK